MAPELSDVLFPLVVELLLEEEEGLMLLLGEWDPEFKGVEEPGELGRGVLTGDEEGDEDEEGTELETELEPSPAPPRISPVPQGILAPFD